MCPKYCIIFLSRLRRAASTDTGSLFSASIYNDTSDDDLVSYGDDLDEREDFLASNEPEEEEEEEEGEGTLWWRFCCSVRFHVAYTHIDEYLHAHY